MFNGIGNNRAFNIYPQPQFTPEAPSDSPAQLRFKGGQGVLALMVVLLLLAAGMIVVKGVVPMVAHGAAQVAAVRQFCTAEAQHQYGAAFDLLAQDLTQTRQVDPQTRQVDVDQFTDAMKQRDQSDGSLQGCVVTGRDLPHSFASTLFLEPGAVFLVTVTRASGSQSGEVTVIDDHGWKLRYLDANLHLVG